jgi:hypothetical protein
MMTSLFGQICVTELRKCTDKTPQPEHIFLGRFVLLLPAIQFPTLTDNVCDFPHSPQVDMEE